MYFRCWSTRYADGALARERGQEYSAGAISLVEFDASVQGWITHVHYTDTWGRRQHVLNTPLRRPEKPSYAFAHCARFFAVCAPLCHNTACWLQPMIAHQEGVSVLLCSGCLL
jgi:hypothetical protein